MVPWLVGQKWLGADAPPAGSFTQGSAGHIHACAVRQSGVLACWAHYLDGQTVPPEGSFLWVSACQFHNCRLRTGGWLDCWGAMGYRQAPRIYIGPETLPNGVVGIAYSQQFWSVGGQSPYPFRVRSGRLTPGLSLDQETGLLSGTPTQAGTYSFSVLSTDCARDFPLVSAQSFEVTITDAGTIYPQVYLPLVGRNTRQN